jgi:Zn ribbon nucleic-acid-binding protein
LRGSGCPSCNNKYKTLDEFKEEVFQLTKTEYIVLGDYLNCYTHTTILHRVCGKIYEVIPNSFLQGSRCPHCSDVNNSRGVKKIIDVLSIKNVSYSREFKTVKI